jgi:hypothetical protein
MDAPLKGSASWGCSFSTYLAGLYKECYLTAHLLPSCNSTIVYSALKAPLFADYDPMRVKDVLHDAVWTRILSPCRSARRP